MGYFDDFASEPLPAPVKASKPKTEFPCQVCGGTGQWRGGTNRDGRRDCFACKGTGKFATSPEHRAKARARAAEKRDQVAIDFAAEHADLWAFLLAADWSDFACDVVADIRRGKGPTENRLRACYSMMAKCQTKRAEAIKARVSASVAVDLTPIRTMFETAVASGHKKPCYRAEGLVISRAPDGGKNPGALYVKDPESDAYLGKILGVTFTPSRDGMQAGAALLAIAADPLAAAVAWGKKYGRCSCCGRELSDPASVAAGIGPICAAGWGF